MTWLKCVKLSVVCITIKYLYWYDQSIVFYVSCVYYLQTFREKKKNISEGTTRFDLHKRANASLNAGIDLKQVVKLPPEEEVNDWIAVHGNLHTLECSAGLLFTVDVMNATVTICWISRSWNIVTGKLFHHDTCIHTYKATCMKKISTV